MKIEEFIKCLIFKKSIYILLFIIISGQSIKAFEQRVSVSVGGGWKSNVDPAFSFRSASDIFNRSVVSSSATMLFSTEAEIQSENDSGFVVDFGINGLLSLRSIENSTIDSSIDGGYIYTVNEKNIFAFIAGIHNSAFDYSSFRSLFIDPRFSISYLYDSLSFYAIFLRSGVSYFVSTNSLVEYLNGPSVFLEAGTRFNFDKYGIIDGFAGASSTFFSNQNIQYNRYKDVYYGDLEIIGKYFSLYGGISYQWTISVFTFPLSLKYIFSRSFENDTHKIVYWSDMGISPRIYEKTRIDNTIEFSAGFSVELGANFSLESGYFLQKTFSNVGADFGDYADYSRLAHTFSLELVYEY